MTIEPARVNDTQAIVSVFIANQDDPGLFQEHEAEVKRNLRDFFVARDADGKFVACAVLPEFQGQGIGTMLIRKFAEKAAACQVTHLWLATTKPEYFRRYSFRPIFHWSLPTTVLLCKVRQVFQQPVQRWVPVLLGRHTFMQCSLVDRQPS